MKTKVVLDAIIPKEDFDILGEENGSSNSNAGKSTLSVVEFENDSFFLAALRKPDFQRETNEWSPEKIYELLHTFINGELIPSVILWKSKSNNIFVIDGSHRISALAAWINDDYGDGEISLKFYESDIPTAQAKAARMTRDLINSNIGSYQDIKNSIKNENNDQIKIAKKLGSLALQVQWVAGNSKSAENSFFNINQQGTPISTTELELIKSRSKPNGLATRAIVRSGKGHNYWSNFNKEIQSKIYTVAKEINDLLFLPEYKTPIKSLDLPIGGNLHSENGQALILETINISNDFSDTSEIKDDLEGSRTLKCLKNCLSLIRRINSRHPSSLGLHSIIYFYSIKGAYKIASYYSILTFVVYLEEKNKFEDFISIREQFEEILLLYDFFVQTIGRKYRNSSVSRNYICDYYIEILELLLKGKSIDETMHEIIKYKKFSYLSEVYKPKSEITTSKFSDSRKSNIFIRTSISGVPKCSHCNGLLHQNSITIDHITRVQDGGKGTVDNGQLMHPYCNSTSKN